MRHQVAGRKLGRTTAHRWALFRNQVASLVDKERIQTTLPKAKELRSMADHMITLGKKNNLAARRQAFYFLRDKGLVTKLFSELAPRFASRLGGYTRVLKTGFRLGDAAPLAFIEYLDRPETQPVQKGAKKGSSEKVVPVKDKKVAKVKTEKAPKAAKKEKTVKEAKEAKVKKETVKTKKSATVKKAAKKTTEK